MNLNILKKVDFSNPNEINDFIKQLFEDYEHVEGPMGISDSVYSLKNLTYEQSFLAWLTILKALQNQFLTIGKINTSKFDFNLLNKFIDLIKMVLEENLNDVYIPYMNDIKRIHALTIMGKPEIHLAIIYALDDLIFSKLNEKHYIKLSTQIDKNNHKLVTLYKVYSDFLKNK